MWTGLVIAIALTAQAAPAGQNATTLTPDVSVSGARQGASSTARNRDPNEVICENRATTGSRFTNRRCRTRAQAQAASTEARRWLGEALRGGPTPEDLATTTGPSPIGP